MEEGRLQEAEGRVLGPQRQGEEEDRLQPIQLAGAEEHLHPREPRV